LDQRLVDLEAQIDRLTQSLLRWREADDYLEPAARRLTQFSEQCAAILRDWTTVSERHAHVVGELESRLTGWNEIETRLQRDVTARFQGLERLIEHEWASLRRLHEEPTRQLREHAESLTEICVTTAGSAQTGIERAEARLATLEKDLHRRMDDLSRDFHAVLAELRQQGIANLRSPAGSWSLDEVARLHQELRDSAAPSQSRPAPRSGSVLETSPLALRTISTFVEPDAKAPGATLVQPSDADRGAGERATRDRSAWKWYAVAAVLAIATGVAGGFAFSFYNRARLAAEDASEARQRAELTATTANERIDATRRDAAAQVALARDAASKAQVTGDILAAPDLVRFNLIGGDVAARTSAQLLWSRSRGLVFSGSRMPPLPPGAVYQIWLLTAGDPVSAGTVTPDASGRATLATDSPPDVPRPIVAVRVTLESAPGSAAPSGATVLSRNQ
jgi:hypothetical protein